MVISKELIISSMLFCHAASLIFLRQQIQHDCCFWIQMKLLNALSSYTNGIEQRRLSLLIDTSWNTTLKVSLTTHDMCPLEGLDTQKHAPSVVFILKKMKPFLIIAPLTLCALCTFSTMQNSFSNTAHRPAHSAHSKEINDVCAWGVPSTPRYVENSQPFLLTTVAPICKAVQRTRPQRVHWKIVLQMEWRSVLAAGQ